MTTCDEEQITKQDLQLLIAESIRDKNRECFYKIAQIVVTPIIITLVSLIITWRINNRQALNTQQITAKQIESAQIIAQANIDNSAKISESDQRIERLTQVKEIFKGLLSNGKTDFSDENIESMRMQIVSLEVYKEDALLFLLNIREHYKNKLDQYRNKRDQSTAEKQKGNLSKLIAQTDKSIESILLNSQIDLSNREYWGLGEKSSADSGEYSPPIDVFKEELRKCIGRYTGNTSEDKYDLHGTAPAMDLYNMLHLSQLNMKKAKYTNYNFSNSTYINVCLYRADFSSCTLKNTIFANVDFQKASFTGSDLTKALFWNCNLKKADFSETKLDSVVFVNPISAKKDASRWIKAFCEKNGCCELEGARFGFSSLLHLEKGPFKIFNKESYKDLNAEMRKELLTLYIDLLSNHYERIAGMAKVAANNGDEGRPADFERLLVNTGTISWQALDKELKAAQKQRDTLAEGETAHEFELMALSTR